MTEKIPPGSRLRSQVCQTEVVVVRSGSGAVELTCGGVRMVPLDAAFEAPASPDADLMTGTAIGKRYYSARDETFEVLVTRQGEGTLGDRTDPLLIKSAKPLPSSD
jgi:hypothetical protein